jgi:cholesterol oxidase
VIVVGSGFGGSVAALRLSEKGYRVGVLEAGARFDPTNLPRSSWDVRHFLWAPQVGCFGIQRVHFLRDVVVLAGAGVGGGSLNYANTLYEPPAAFYDDPQWPRPADWDRLLKPHYELAKRMLGAVPCPTVTPADEAMLEVARQMGAEGSFGPTPVGVFFGPPGTPPGTALPDPYFGGAGPLRRTCVQCGECMTGCRKGAKNTLLTNYLHLAERAGAVVLPMTTACCLRPGDGGGWVVGTVKTSCLGSGRPKARRVRELTAGQVVMAAGTFGTQKLLHAMALEGTLTGLSPRLGKLTRTNSESLLGAVVPLGRARTDYSQGVAITSSFYPDPRTHVEPVRYGHGSNMMGLFGSLLVDGPPGGQDRPAGLGRLLSVAARHPRTFLGFFDLRAWSERTVIALVMQPADNSLTLSAKTGLFGRPKLSSRQGHGHPNPIWSGVGHEVARRLAVTVGGNPSGTWGEIFGVPMTAHFLGGCTIGASAAEGVVDPWHRVYGHEGLHIVDGSAVPANPGVNPALTITAMAERAFAHWPNRGGPDPRPPLGAAPNRVTGVETVPPKWPAVPAGAPAALRLSPPGGHVGSGHADWEEKDVAG